MARLLGEAVAWATVGDGCCVITHPVDSYLWRLLNDVLPDHAPTDIDYCRCMFGDTIRGATRIRTYGDLSLSPLALVCRRLPTGLLCGSAAHAPLGYAEAQRPTDLPDKFCKRFAGLIAKWALAPTGRDRVQVTSSGRVARHRDRGESPASRRERHASEDAASTAGARNPAQVVAAMPRMIKAMARVRRALLRAMDRAPGIRDCHLACGLTPPREPPHR